MYKDTREALTAERIKKDMRKIVKLAIAEFVSLLFISWAGFGSVAGLAYILVIKMDLEGPVPFPYVIAAVCGIAPVAILIIGLYSIIKAFNMIKRGELRIVTDRLCFYTGREVIHTIFEFPFFRLFGGRYTATYFKDHGPTSVRVDSFAGEGDEFYLVMFDVKNPIPYRAYNAKIYKLPEWEIRDRDSK